MLTCSFDEAEGGREEDVLLVVPGSVPLTVVVALTRLEGGSARVWVDARVVVVLVTVVRGTLPRVRAREAGGAVVDEVALDSSGLVREPAADDAFTGRTCGAVLP